MSEEVMQIIGYGAMALMLLLLLVVIAQFRLEFYEMGKKKLLKRKIREKTLIPAANQSLEDVAEKLKEFLDFQAKKVEVHKNEIEVNLFVDDVKSEITIHIKLQDGYFVVRPLVSDALHWNIAGQVEETLAYVCGEKATICNDDARYEFAKILRIRKFEKKYKWICIGAAIVWGAIAIFLYYNTTDYIDAVKETVLTDTDAPIGEVFDDFFGEQEWSNADANVDGYAFVIMEGACYYEVSIDSSREKVDVEIEFLINEENGELTIQNISVDGELLDTNAQAELIEDVYETHMARTSFQSVEDVLTDFGNFIGNEMMEGLMGHYVSYYSKEDEELAYETFESEENSADEAMKAYKAECQDFDYREYFRYEQEHLGEKIKLEMQVEQIIDGAFRGYDAQGNEYYIIDEREEESPFRVMEGDVLTVYGEYSGVLELTRAMEDYESEVFSITARYADLMEEEGEITGADYSGLSNYIGTWQDQYSQRCNMEISSLTESEVSVLIRWGSSATEESQWTMTGVYQPDSGILEYTDGVLTDNVYQDNGAISSEEAYSGGTGRFYIEDGYLYWIDDVENQGAECYFQRIGEVSTEPETMVEQVEADNPYQDSILLWKSYYVALTDADCMGLSKEELRIARNEIYAAYGRIFTSQDLIDYFNSKPWYQGTIPSDQFDDSVLTEIQKANIRTIQSYEELADEGSDYSVRGLAINDEYAIPQKPGEYTYVNNSDDSQYVILTVGRDVSLAFWGATGCFQKLSGFNNINDQEYSNSGAGVSLIFNNYGREMVYIMSDGTQITYTFSY